MSDAETLHKLRLQKHNRKMFAYSVTGYGLLPQLAFCRTPYDGVLKIQFSIHQPPTANMSKHMAGINRCGTRKMDNRGALVDEAERELRRMLALVNAYTTKLIEIAGDREEAIRILRERLRAIDEFRLNIDPDLYRLVDAPDLLKTSAEILFRKPSFKARCVAILTELNGVPIPALQLKQRIEQEGGKKFAKTIAATTLSRLVVSGEVLKTPHGYAIAKKVQLETRGTATVAEVKSYVRLLLMKHGPLKISTIYELLKKHVIVPGEDPETNIHTILSKDLNNFVKILPSTYSLPEIEALKDRPSRQKKHIRMRRVLRPGTEE